MKKAYTCLVLFILLISSSALAQIWLVRNVSNVFIDDCYISFGNKLGIAWCNSERYVEPQKIEEWSDSAFVYVLYPVYPLLMPEPPEADTTNTKKKERHRKSKKHAASQNEVKSDSVKVNQPPTPTWKFTEADSLLLVANGKLFYKYEDILLYKTYKPLQEADITSYRSVQLFKPAPKEPLPVEKR